MRDTRHIFAPLLVAAVLALAAGLPAVARGDGDPASDVLVGQDVFAPADASTAAGAARLQAATAAAARSGYPIRVALIGSGADLGSVTSLWRRPEQYARFLGQELSLAAPGRVLVVMPNGFGLAPATARAAAVLARLPVARRPAGLPAAALAAVARLAAMAGHPLPRSALAAQSTSAAAGAGDAVAWIVFAGGCAAIALAWGLSLRARPLRSHGGEAPA